MKQIIILFTVLMCSVLYVSGQKEEILLTIGDTKISKAEFERIYKKNNDNLYNDSDRKTPKEYLELFINYKLKVIEATRLKMDTNKVFRDELAGYRAELAAPYLTDIKYNEEQVEKLYERMTKEINASHILLRINQGATSQEARAVLDKIQKIREEILAGKDFNKAAEEYSEDPSAKMNGGNLGYFTAFQMVGPFEDAAFNLKAGEVSQPVRTSFGYHLIKVHDIRENQGELKVAHIMKMFPQGINAAGKKKFKAEIDSIYKMLLNGADFAEMAQKVSDDKRSAVQGGEMPWFSAGRMIPEFAEPAFAIENAGEITEPIETQFGYHIIKKLDQRTIPDFETAKPDIEKRIKNDPTRSISSKRIFIEKLKNEYGFSENDENLSALKDKNIGDKTDNNVLFTLGNADYSMDGFNKYLQDENITSGNYLINYDNWVETEITKFEDSRLETKYPEFRYLIQEYHDGILLFNIMEEKIWNFAAQDTAGLEQYYAKNKNKFNWEERFEGSVITCENVEVREEAEKYFAADMTNEEILDMLNQDKKKIEIITGAWEKESNPVVDYYVWNGQEPENFDQELTFIRGDKIAPESKTLEEARGLYISEYQNYLEQEWLKNLHKKYKIKVNKKLLKTIPNV